ncbi:hypothetical protein [Metabacillus schmidteae]|uniref:hypothetical protein n=1 Tax=Metabacillus schmidteae TaxID=2730405 RepID=UPI00158F3C1D|nr:hypothetical protein [Metabacillus schmidteae]
MKKNIGYCRRIKEIEKQTAGTFTITISGYVLLLNGGVVWLSERKDDKAAWEVLADELLIEEEKAEWLKKKDREEVKGYDIQQGVSTRDYYERVLNDFVESQRQGFEGIKKEIEKAKQLMIDRGYTFDKQETVEHKDPQIKPEEFLLSDEEIRKLAEESARESGIYLKQERYIRAFTKGFKSAQERTYKRLKELECGRNE